MRVDDLSLRSLSLPQVSASTPGACRLTHRLFATNGGSPTEEALRNASCVIMLIFDSRANDTKRKEDPNGIDNAGQP